jgi:hypothetical protein
MPGQEETVPAQLDELVREVRTLSRVVNKIPIDLKDRLVAVETSVEQRKEVMVQVIHSAVKDAMPKVVMTEQHQQWLDAAIEAQAESKAFRRAVIEKSLLSLTLAGGGFLFYVLKDGFAHLFIK